MEINEPAIVNEVTIVKLSALLFPAIVFAAAIPVGGIGKDDKVYEVQKVEDFEITGSGGAAAWAKASWADMKREGKTGLTYFSRFKMVYSSRGLYFFMSGSDELLSATMRKDFMDLFLEDVFEVFLWPDERQPLYFEYEISPLNHELPLLVTNISNRIMGWLPWHYSGARKVRKKTGIIGNKLEPGAVIKGWSAEFFIPFKLLEPLLSSIPKKGDRWRANFYRVDYDGDKPTKWEWSPVGGDFHRPRDFGTLLFR